MRQVQLTIIYGKRDMPDAEWEWIRGLATPVKTWFVSNLHAKCYLSEDAAIITSMNLYEFSQQNNDEMGIYVSRSQDPVVYGKITEEAQRLQRMATPGQGAPTETRPSTAPDQPSAAIPDKQDSPLGYCIRCQAPVTLDPEKPYCYQHFRIWARYGDEAYEEKFCHRCGKEHTTSMAKPLCLPCFRRG